MSNLLGEHAVVIGGSMAGLMTARVLADFFEQVTVLERDQIEGRPANHKSILQGNHLHALMLGGQQTVQGLVWEKDRVQGVRYTDEGAVNSLSADLIVDAGGRGSRAPRWLTEHGFQVPAETTIGVDFAYSSTKFRIPDYDGEPERVLFFGSLLQFPKGAGLQEIENETWLLSLFGRFGDYPPVDEEEGFLAFVRSLPTPRLYEIIRGAERVTDIVQHRFPTSVQRHYDRLPAFPEGFLVLGDAISSFNPIYGQGMSSAALQVKALQDELTQRADRSQGLEGVGPDFFEKAAEVIATPWALAAATDFVFPKTTGQRPPNLEEDARYFAALDALAAEDSEVQRLLSEVIQLAKPLSALSEEPLRSRVLGRQGRPANA